MAPKFATGNSHGASSPTPRSSPVASAIGRHKLLVLVCALVVAAVGAAGGYARKASYTAAATLQVGKVNPNSPGFYGFVQSAGDLATAFSRAVDARPVLETVHHRLGLSQAAAAGRLAAEPIPNSPVFRVIATGPSERDAIALANTASTALIAYEAKANTYSPESQRLLASYRYASLLLTRAQQRVTTTTASEARLPTTAGREKVEAAQANRSAAALQAQALASAYQQTAQSTTTRDLISLLAGAVSATSDHKSKIELLGFIGLLGGLVIGCAMAVLVDLRGRSRRLPAEPSYG